MKPDGDECDLSRLVRYLDDPSDVDAAALDLHLEACEPCRRSLDRLAAGDDWWGVLPRLAFSDGPDVVPAADLLPGFLEATDLPGCLGLLGPYEICGLLGRGGMGIVFRGFDPALGRPVAIKILSPHLASDASARLRFAREAKAAAAVSHDHVVAIHAVDAWRGLPYLVMPYIRGLSLQQRLERDGILETAEVLRIALQVARGLAAAHAQGLVHRDIKPANILLEDGVERVKLTDFGLARTADDASLTLSGVLAGTPAYMSPEQVRGDSVDARSDLFSLGSVMYAMCAGNPPFRAPTTMAVLRRVGEDRPRPIRDVNPAAPAWLATLITRLLAKDPSARFRSAGELADVLELRLSQLQGPDSRPGLPATRPAPPRRRLGLRYTVAATLALAALGASEARGLTDVTGFVATVLRVRTPDGTLVVRLEDPETTVAVDGETLVISGPGLREIRLRPGPHRIEASRDGTPVLDELVSISRGDTRVVTVSREHASPAHDSGQALPAPPRVAEAFEESDPGKFTSTGRAITLSLARPTPMVPTRVLAATPGGQARVAAFSPDGRTLATGGTDQVVRLWDLPKGGARAELRGHAAEVRHAYFSADGRKLMTSGERRDLHSWDVASGADLPLSSRNLRRSGALGMSPDGATLASLDSEDVLSLWDVASLRERLSFRMTPPLPIAPRLGVRPLQVNGLALSPGGKLLAGAVMVQGQLPEGRAYLWDASTGTLLSTTVARGASSGAIAFSPDGRTLASSSFDGTITLWDVESGSVRATLTNLWTFAEPIAFSPDGTLLAAGHSDGIVTLWDPGSAEPLALFRGHPSQVHGVAFSPDGSSLATASADSLVKIWNLSTVRHPGEAGRPPR